MKKLAYLSSLLLLIGCGSDTTEDKVIELVQADPVDLVNPFIGTGGHGHTYPGATMPFGMVQLSPDTRLDGWDGCSGYHYTDSVIYGFSHTHLSGTGVSDYGDVLLTPFNSSDIPAYQELMDHSKTKSHFDKTNEEAYPGYYRVTLGDFKISAELTATTRVGIHQYIFNDNSNRKIAINLNHRDKVLDSGFKLINDSTIVGKRVSAAWATEQHVYFAIQFSEPFKLEYPSGQATVQDLFRVVVFENKDSIEPIPLITKVAISPVSTDGALMNLKAEAPHWDFHQYVQDARKTWEKQLNKIKVKGTDKDKMTVFYSALYHTMIAPNTFSDVDGSYRGMDKKIHKSSDHNMYTVFSLWDTYRATHPLYTIIEQEKTNEFINTFLNQHQQGGRLPVWELAGNETECMIGYHSVPVIYDAYVKGVRGYPVDSLLMAMEHAAKLDHFGLDAYKRRGYIESGDEGESVSKTLEYAYDDWCIAQMAKAEGKMDLYKEFIARAQSYKNLFNPSNGFMQSKNNGRWSYGFKPAEVNFNFTEANSWQYSMYVPQDITGMICLHGGFDNFDKKLDELFTTEMELSGRHQVDITGLIGQYAHGNEPSHHMAYLYNYVAKPWKTQERVHQILTEQYWNAPDGLSGNEDCGQMSAWYVMSSLGFYSVTPGMGYYAIGTPLFNEAEINLENGKQFKIKANNLSEMNKYIQSATLNGKPYSKSLLYHKDIMAGGELVFEMGKDPNKEWGSKEDDYPVSSIVKEDQLTAVPYFNTESSTFTEDLKIDIKSIDSDAKIYYTVNGGEEQEFKGPFTIAESSDFVAYAVRNGVKSKTVTSNYLKIKGGRSIEIKSKYDNQYAAGGDEALIDGLRGGDNYRTGYWQGYQGQDVHLIINLGELEKVNKVKVGAIQDIKSWIWFPKSVEIWTSTDGKDFKPHDRISIDKDRKTYGTLKKDYELKVGKEVQYIEIKATYPGDCPDWHLGAGGKAWMFFDEVIVE